MYSTALLIIFYGHYNKDTLKFEGYLFENGCELGKNAKITEKYVKSLFKNNYEAFHGTFSPESTLGNLIKEKGLYKISKASYYDGFFNKDGQFDGVGKLVDKNGKFYGIFGNGKKNGSGIWELANGGVETGVWKNNYPFGTLRIDHPDGTKEFVTYVKQSENEVKTEIDNRSKS